MDEAIAIAERSGLIVLGSRGTEEDVWSVWRAFIVTTAVPIVRVPDTDDGDEMRALQGAWLERARATRVVSSDGEFLLSVQTSRSIGSWLHVRLSDEFDIGGLGLTWALPEFVASDLGRTVSISVSTEEDDYQIFLSHTDPATGKTPVPTGRTS